MGFVAPPSEAEPNIRRCDGISYVPYTLACSNGGSNVVPASGTGGSASVKDACNDSCSESQFQCSSRCNSVFDPQCKPRCNRERLTCMKKC